MQYSKVKETAKLTSIVHISNSEYKQITAATHQISPTYSLKFIMLYWSNKTKTYQIIKHNQATLVIGASNSMKKISLKIDNKNIQQKLGMNKHQGHLSRLTLYPASDHIQPRSQCQCFQAYQITDQSGDAILGCSTHRRIRCCVSFYM